MALVDLSHTIVHGMTTYPGLPGPLICDFLSREASRGRYAPGVEFQIGKIEMVANRFIATRSAAGFRFSAVPAKVAGFGTWPVRAFAAL